MAVLIVSGATIAMAIYPQLSPKNNPRLVRYLLFIPWKKQPQPNPLLKIAGIPGIEITLNTGENTIDCWYYKYPGAKNVVLISHGTGRNSAYPEYTAKTETFLNCKYSVFVYDYEGYGKSTGEPSPEAVINDGVVAYDYLNKTLNYQPRQIVAYGLSLGSGVTMELTKRRKFSKVIVEAAFSSIQDVLNERVPAARIYPKSQFFTPGFETIETVKSPHPPLLIIHGKHDPEILWHHGQDIYDAACQPKSLLVLENSAHGVISAADQDAYMQTIKQFLAQ